MSDLLSIQQSLIAPKNQTNNFGKYNYRSCESILEALKKPLAETGCHVTLSDEIQLIGDRFYVKATASLYKGSELIAAVSAYARESESKKGMDDSQLTGSTSSYARKYALSGLFAIDDNKDADSNEYRASRDLMGDIKVISDIRSVDDLNEFWRSVSPSYSGEDFEKLKTAAARRKSQILPENGGGNQ